MKNDNTPHWTSGIEWTENPAQETTDGIPYATHSGVLELFGHSLRCHRLSTGEAIIEDDDMAKLFEDPDGL